MAKYLLILTALLTVASGAFAHENKLVKSQIKEQAGTVLVDANLIAPFVQIDSATISALTVSSLTVTDSTLVPGAMFLATTQTVTASKTYQAPSTFSSSVTVNSNFGVNGNIDRPATFTSSATFNANVGINGNVTRPLTVTSSVTLTSFSADASTITASVLTRLMVTPSGGTQFNSELCGQESQTTITAATATTVTTAFVKTSLAGSVTPHSTSSYIKLRACGTIQQNNAASAVNLTFLRDTTTLSGTQGFARQALAGSTADLMTTACMYYIDSPSSTSAITYTVGLKAGANTATFCGANQTCTLTIQECITQ